MGAKLEAEMSSKCSKKKQLETKGAPNYPKGPDKWHAKNDVEKSDIRRKPQQKKAGGGELTRDLNPRSEGASSRNLTA